MNLVPFVEDEQTVFLKTIIPSRKATKRYLGDESDDHDEAALAVHEITSGTSQPY